LLWVLAVLLVLVARLAVAVVTAEYFSHQSLMQTLYLLLVLVLLAQGVVTLAWVAVD
jgi:PHD/YefM family antitoxin component YafN of YafNO toxin-antitoxin module